MQELWEFIKKLTDPESILQYGGLALLLIVIFAETGLLIGFFLPGDSLVFISGLFCSVKPQYLSHTPFFLLFLYMTTAAVVGNFFGYFFGLKSGEKLFTKDDNLIFKKRYLISTKDFYDKHGSKALIIGRFFPIIRTFAPILAGAIKLPLKKFAFLNVVGAIAWMGSICGAGYFLGEKYPETEKHLGKIITVMLIFTTLPILIRLRKK
ncbi:MAG: DedA family protein [Bacteroidota bacterium]|jgi:membrane-associated protein